MTNGIDLQISTDMIEAVMKEFEAQNPGKTIADMPPKEFSRRMMEKITASAVSRPHQSSEAK